jgi:hypothetical protein
MMPGNPPIRGRSKPQEKPPEPEKPKLLLPVVPLENLDLAAELYTQYISTKQMLSDAVDEPLNQRAQTVNSIVNILDRITKIRTEIYNAEKLKKLEAALLTTLKEFPELSERFLELYEEEANK